jgi:hypothetical protein
MNTIKDIRNTIHLLDLHIFKIIEKEEIDEKRLEKIVSVRIEYIKELNSLIKQDNTSKMFNS